MATTHTHTKNLNPGLKLTPFVFNPEDVGILSFGNIGHDALIECNKLLDLNHTEHHTFVRDTAGHNHIVHGVLAVMALGGTVEDMKGRFDDGSPMQRPLPKFKPELIDNLEDDEVFYSTLNDRQNVTTNTVFFEKLIARDGYKAVCNKYLFSRSKVAEAMQARLFEGAYHALIHLGYGIEFKVDALIAEGLAQTAAHEDEGVHRLLDSAEREAVYAYPTPKGVPLMQLVNDVRNDDQIRNAPKWNDFGAKMSAGVIGRAIEPMSTVCATFQIFPDEDDLERRTAEMHSVCAFMAGAAQREGRPNKIDFFHMHAVTSSIFMTVFNRCQWITLKDRVRLMEKKARMDLTWYATAGSAALDGKWITEYKNPESDWMDWYDVFDAVNKEHDDGHAAKFIRSLKNGEMLCRRYERSEEWGSFFPMKGDMWLKLARMCQDTTKNMSPDLKWIPFTGFDQPWKRADLLPKGSSETAAEKITLY